ncbi:MAG: NAD(P)-dependent oxidoreductase [Candidatus Magasanikbacteria bacterium]
MTKVAFFETKPIEKKIIKSLTENIEDFEPVIYEEPLTESSIPEENFSIISVFAVGCNVNKKVIKEMPNLEFIATRSTGFDHIDLEACRENGIKVSNVPSYGSNTVAEYTFALILELSRKVSKAYDSLKEPGEIKMKELRGFDLKDKTLGVIGTGDIGCRVVKIADGFGMDVLAYDIERKEELAQKCAMKYTSLEELLQKSDIVTLHVPYMESTHHLINKDNIQKMKEEAYLINTSRGAVVETEALTEALQENHLAGAGLDVLEQEQAIKEKENYNPDDSEDLETILEDYALIDMPSVIVTPHNAYNTREAIERIVETTVENIKSFLNKESQNLVK